MLEFSERGLDYTKIVMAKAASPTDVDAALYAEDRWGRASAPARILKASIGTVGEASPGWGSPLSLQTAAAEFFGIVDARAIVGAMGNSLRRVPLATRLIAAVGATTAYWIGEGELKTVSEAAFDAGELPPNKLAALAVISDELLRSSDPAAEQLIRADLLRACIEAQDRSFADPAQLGVPGIQPASITSLATPLSATGDLDADLRAIVDAFGGNLATSFWIMRPATAVGVHGPTHRDIEATGGALLGIPVITSNSIPADASPDTHSIALIDASAVAIGDGEAEVRTSRQATIQMAEGQRIALFQENAVAVLAERAINWRLMQTDAVAVLDGLTFEPAG